MFERSAIEIAPLAYMRGRTLNHAFIILDEAQNTTPEQMKMFLTRMGFGAKAVVTGDVTQIDLAARPEMRPDRGARASCNEVRGIAFTDFTVDRRGAPSAGARIVDAYEPRAAQDARREMPLRADRPRSPRSSWPCSTPRSAALPSAARLRRWVRAALRARRTRSRCVSSARPKAARSTASIAARTTRPTC